MTRMPGRVSSGREAFSSPLTVTVTVTVTVAGSLNFTIQCTVFNKGPPKPPATRCNIILLSAGVGISLPRPFTLVISPKSFSFLALVFRSTVFVSTCKKGNPLIVVVPQKRSAVDVALRLVLSRKCSSLLVVIVVVAPRSSTVRCAL